MAGKARTLLDELALPLVGSWWTVVAGLCVGLSAGLIAVEYQPTSSRATLTVQTRDDARTAELGAELSHPDILARLAERAGDPRGAGTPTSTQPGAVQKRISVSTLSADMFEVTVRDEDPRAATILAERIGAIVTAPGRPYQLSGPTIAVSGPAAPQPVKVCLLGVAIGLILFVGPPLIRTAVNPFICGEPAIRDMTGLPVLATIPRIETADTAGESRRRITVNVGLATLSAVTLAAVAIFTMA